MRLNLYHQPPDQAAAFAREVAATLAPLLAPSTAVDTLWRLPTMLAETLQAVGRHAIDVPVLCEAVLAAADPQQVRWLPYLLALA